MADKPFKRVGSYDLFNCVGQGSFASVYRGTHRPTGKVIAVKAIIRARLNRKLQENLDAEIRILQSTDHPNVMRLHEVLGTEQHVYLVLEYCPGGDLMQVINTKGAQSEAQTRHYLVQLAHGLAYLRQRNLIHRDLKPQNLLLSSAGPDGVLKIGDFGFARYMVQQDLAETLCGSPLYMAPEILRFHKYDAKADLWSVGAIAFELLTARPPYTGAGHVQLLKNIESKEPNIPPHVSPDCKHMLMGLLQRDPMARFTFETFFAHPFLAAAAAAAAATAAVPAAASGAGAHVVAPAGAPAAALQMSPASQPVQLAAGAASPQQLPIQLELPPATPPQTAFAVPSLAHLPPIQTAATTTTIVHEQQHGQPPGGGGGGGGAAAAARPPAVLQQIQLQQQQILQQQQLRLFPQALGAAPLGGGAAVPPSASRGSAAASTDSSLSSTQPHPDCSGSLSSPARQPAPLRWMTSPTNAALLPSPSQSVATTSPDSTPVYAASQPAHGHACAVHCSGLGGASATDAGGRSPPTMVSHPPPQVHGAMPMGASAHSLHAGSAQTLAPPPMGPLGGGGGGGGQPLPDSPIFLGAMAVPNAALPPPAYLPCAAPAAACHLPPAAAMMAHAQQGATATSTPSYGVSCAPGIQMAGSAPRQFVGVSMGTTMITHHATPHPASMVDATSLLPAAASAAAGGGGGPRGLTCLGLASQPPVGLLQNATIASLPPASSAAVPPPRAAMALDFAPPQQQQAAPSRQQQPSPTPTVTQLPSSLSGSDSDYILVNAPSCDASTSAARSATTPPQQSASLADASPEEAAAAAESAGNAYLQMLLDLANLLARCGAIADLASLATEGSAHGERLTTIEALALHVKALDLISQGIAYAERVAATIAHAPPSLQPAACEAVQQAEALRTRAAGLVRSAEGVKAKVAHGSSHSSLTQLPPQQQSVVSLQQSADPMSVCIEEILYQQALSIGREAAVEELLGNVDSSAVLYVRAKLTFEQLALEATVGEADRVVLRKYAAGFAWRLAALREKQQQRLSGGGSGAFTMGHAEQQRMSGGGGAFDMGDES